MARQAAWLEGRPGLGVAAAPGAGRRRSRARAEAGSYASSSSRSSLRKASGCSTRRCRRREGSPHRRSGLGQQVIGDCWDCGDCVRRRRSALAFFIIRTYTCSLPSAAEALWKFGLAGSRSVTVSASRHRSTDLILYLIQRHNNNTLVTPQQQHNRLGNRG